MKLLAYLVMALGVVLGTISAATAYMVPLDRGSQTLSGITLAAPAGAFDPTLPSGPDLTARIAGVRGVQAARRAEQAADTTPLVVREAVVVEDLAEVPGVVTQPTATQTIAARNRLSPIARPGDELDEAMIALLQDHGVHYVKVQSFNPGIWMTMWQSWIFLLSIVMLFGSAMFARSISRRETATPEAQAAADPEQIARRIAAEVSQLIDDLQAMPDRQLRLRALVDRLGAVQRDDVPAFVATRAELINRYGLGGFAEIMDVFAAMERQINRSWSAAADGVEQEATDSLQRAHAILPELQSRVAGKA